MKRPCEGLWAKSLTITRYDPERDGVPGFLDQVDDVRMWLVGDGAAVNSQYSVPYFQLPAAVRRAALDDASYFVGHGHTCIASYGQFDVLWCVIQCVRMCGCVWRRKKRGKRSRKRGSEGEGLIHWQPAEPRSLREANQEKKRKNDGTKCKRWQRRGNSNVLCKGVRTCRTVLSL